MGITLFRSGSFLWVFVAEVYRFEVELVDYLCSRACILLPSNLSERSPLTLYQSNGSLYLRGASSR